MPGVFINDRCLLRPATGVGMYLRNLLAAWPAESSIRPATCWTRPAIGVKASADPDQAPRTISPIRFRPLADIRPPGALAGRFPPWARRWILRAHDRAFLKRLKRSGCEAYLEPNHLAIPSGALTAATVHDLSVIDHPEWHPPDRVRHWEAALPAAIEATRAWLADSRFTARRMREAMSIPADRITVVPLAARPLPWPDVEEVDDYLERADLPERYFLHLGTIEPRKNIPALLDAYAALPEAIREDVPLVLAGGAGWGDAAFWRRLTEHKVAKEVLWTGYVGDAAVALLLMGAMALLAPSHYEGFGLPILEAMSVGTPVVCSKAEAFGEIAGHAAEMLDADDVPAWSWAMRRMDADWARRERRGQTGRIQANAYTWHATAAATARVLERLVGRKEVSA